MPSGAGPLWAGAAGSPPSPRRVCVLNKAEAEGHGAEDDEDDAEGTEGEIAELAVDEEEDDPDDEDGYGGRYGHADRNGLGADLSGISFQRDRDQSDRRVISRPSASPVSARQPS